MLSRGARGDAADKLISKALDEGQREMVCGVAIDMSAPFIKAIRSHLPNADVVHDKFHVAKHLNEAVDKTRRKEHRKLTRQKDDRLKGTKYAWLKGMEHLSDASLQQVESLAKAELGVAKAWLHQGVVQALLDTARCCIWPQLFRAVVPGGI